MTLGDELAQTIPVMPDLLPLRRRVAGKQARHPFRPGRQTKRRQNLAAALRTQAASLNQLGNLGVELRYPVRVADEKTLVELLHQVAQALVRSEEHTSELQSRPHLVCRLLLEKKK